MGVGPWELAVILLVVIIVFGVGKLPEVGTGLGEGIKNFKKAMNDIKGDNKDSGQNQGS